MIIGIIVLILSVLEFIRSFKVHGNDTVLQKIYYYIGGYAGLSFWIWMLWFVQYGNHYYYTGNIYMYFDIRVVNVAENYILL